MAAPDDFIGRYIRLPPELLVKVAQWIPDTTTFFSFLDAIGAARGPLETLWTLGQDVTLKRSELWPKLRLTGDMLQNPFARAAMEKIVQHYSVIGVAWTTEIDWLQCHVQPHTAIEWIVRVPTNLNDEDFGAWIAQFPTIRLTKLKIFVSKYPAMFVPRFFAVLPRCCDLVSLDLDGHIDIAAVFDFARVSHLQSLQLCCRDRAVLTTPVLQYATEWLITNPVRHLTLIKWSFESSIEAIHREAFYMALFQCPTLAELHLSRCDLRDLTTLTSLSPALSDLSLVVSQLTPSNLATLAHVLPHSSIRQLGIKGLQRDPTCTEEEYLTAFVLLFEAVVTSSVQALALDNCQLIDLAWPRLEPILLQTKLKTLSLCGNSIMDVGAMVIASALQVNSTVQSLKLISNRISADGIDVILDLKSLETLSVSNNLTTQEDEGLLYEVAKERGITLFI
ncbi:Aste57867_8346 [Aphanomyces stellatus]|uniref:Aste57867_8346 protein n=1 Tax=Aphanomyces stellatus TaxID=120398 RepID=A0A485KK06_9STRA|nr:hypothetical protein As57867_008314 [Aphanomyces stellatus]VFT85233.1 Aste57867_8346 [Aphanomyces stellatus]